MVEGLKLLANFIPLVAGAVLMGAALLDFLYYRLPNKLFYVLFYLFPLYIILSLKFHLVSNYSVFVGAMLIGFGLFSAGLIGGGDAKLLSAVSLWVGWNNLMPFLAGMMISGGGIAALYLIFPQYIYALSAQARLFIQNHAAFKKSVQVLVPDIKGIEQEVLTMQGQRMIPYGISIAAAGLMTLLKGGNLNMQRLEALIAVISLGIAVLVAFGIYHLIYTAPTLNNRKVVCPKPPELREVMVANKLINTGDPIADSIFYEKWPQSSSRSEFYFKDKASPETIKSLIARRVINQGEPITQASVVDRKAHGVLSALLKEGMRAISISLDPNTGMAGLLSPGDIVDVLLSLNVSDKEKEEVNQTLLCGVRILALDQRLSTPEGDLVAKKAAEAGQTPKSVTLEVTPQQAVAVASAARQGTLSLSLHSTNDTRNTCIETALKPAEKIRIIRGDGAQATPQQGR